MLRFSNNSCKYKGLFGHVAYSVAAAYRTESKRKVGQLFKLFRKR